MRSESDDLNTEAFEGRRCWVDAGGFAIAEFDDVATALLSTAPMGAVIRLLHTNEALFCRDRFGRWSFVLEARVA